MPNNEINFFDIDEEKDTYFEVELWADGDCDSHFFRRKNDAMRFFKKMASDPFDCVKRHDADLIGGNCHIIAEMA